MRDKLESDVSEALTPGSSGVSRRQVVGMAGLLAAGFTLGDLALFPLPPAQAAVAWFHPFQTQGRISSGFGPRRNPVTGAYQSLHDGIDYSPPLEGTPIRTVASGTVSYVQPYNDGGYGYHVTVDHADGYQTLYGHMQASSLRVSLNQRVGASAIVGTMGMTGSSYGAHLHLRLHRNGNPLDPKPFVHNATLATANEQPISDGRREVQVISNTNRGVGIIGSNPAAGPANYRQLGTNEQVYAALKAWGQAVELSDREFDLVRALATNTGIA